MNITNVRVDLEDHHSLRAYCTVEVGKEFVIKQVKIVEKQGRLIVCMPSKKRTTPCNGCNAPCPITEEFCQACGLSQGPQEQRVERLRDYLGAKPDARLSFYTDLFHPITSECRAQLERAVLEAYREARERLPNAGGHPQGDDARAAVERLVDGGAGARPTGDAAG